MIEDDNKKTGRQYYWELDEGQVKAAIKLWVESQPEGFKVADVIIRNPAKFSEIGHRAVLIEPAKLGTIDRPIPAIMPPTPPKK